MTDHDLDTRSGPVRHLPPSSDLDQWLQALAAELGVDLGVVDVPAVLDAAGAAARSAGRPAGPVTTFLVGYAAAQGPAALADALLRTTRLAEQWPARLGATVGQA